MTLQPHPIAAQRIADIVRFDPGVIRVLADAGIGPRFVTWTLDAAAREVGADLNAIVSGLRAQFARLRQPG